MAISKELKLPAALYLKPTVTCKPSKGAWMDTISILDIFEDK